MGRILIRVAGGLVTFVGLIDFFPQLSRWSDFLEPYAPSDARVWIVLVGIALIVSPTLVPRIHSLWQASTRPKQQQQDDVTKTDNARQVGASTVLAPRYETVPANRGMFETRVLTAIGGAPKTADQLVTALRLDPDDPLSKTAVIDALTELSRFGKVGPTSEDAWRKL